MQAFILATLIVIFTIILGRIVILDTERSKNHKKFLKDMEEFDNKRLKFKKYNGKINKKCKLLQL